MSRTYRKCAYTTEYTFEDHLRSAHPWYYGFRWVKKARTEEEIAEHQRNLDKLYEENLKDFYRGKTWYFPYRRNATKYRLVKVDYPYEEFLRDELSDYRSHFRDGCNGHRRSYREYAIDGVVCGWRDAPASYKKIPVRIARRQQKLMLQKEIADVVDSDL